MTPLILSHLAGCQHRLATFGCGAELVGPRRLRTHARRYFPLQRCANSNATGTLARNCAWRWRLLSNPRSPTAMLPASKLNNVTFSPASRMRCTYMRPARLHAPCGFRYGILSVRLRHMQQLALNMLHERNYTGSIEVFPIYGKQNTVVLMQPLLVVVYAAHRSTPPYVELLITGRMHNTGGNQ